MKKIILFIFGILLVAGNGNPHGMSMTTPVAPATIDNWTQMKAADFVKLTIRDFAKLSHKKLTIKEKISFVVLKKKLKRELKKNPDLVVGAYLAENKKISTGAWIAIIIGVLLFLLIFLGNELPFAANS
ncbi:MAG: hypothetical protein ACO25B_02550, partial [Chitinophagaceae bacterium]